MLKHDTAYSCLRYVFKRMLCYHVTVIKSIICFVIRRLGYDNTMGFRDVLRDEMAYQGITARELAERAGLRKRTIDNYVMANAQEPGVTNAHKIAVALGVSVEYLVTGREYGGGVPMTGEVIDLVRSFARLPSDRRELVLRLVKELGGYDEK